MFKLIKNAIIIVLLISATAFAQNEAKFSSGADFYNSQGNGKLRNVSYADIAGVSSTVQSAAIVNVTQQLNATNGSITTQLQVNNPIIPAATWALAYTSSYDFECICEFQGKLFSGHSSGTSSTIYVFDGNTWQINATFTEAFVYDLCEFQGNLYACVGTTGSVYVYNGTTWSLSYDSDEATIHSLCVYQGKLYAGSTGNGYIYVFDGTTWSLSYDSADVGIYRMVVFGGKLYAISYSTVGAVYVFDGATWDLAYNPSAAQIRAIGVYQGKLYIGTSNDGIIYVFDGKTWTLSYDSSETYIYSLQEYRGKLYAAAGEHGIIYVFDGKTWVISYDSAATEVITLYPYNGVLYAGSYPYGVVYKLAETTPLIPASANTPVEDVPHQFNAVVKFATGVSVSGGLTADTATSTTCTANVFVDLTQGFEGDALAEIAEIKNTTTGEIYHPSLGSTRVIFEEKIPRKIFRHKSTGEIIPQETPGVISIPPEYTASDIIIEETVETVLREGRKYGAEFSRINAAIQQLNIINNQWRIRLRKVESLIMILEASKENNE